MKYYTKKDAALKALPNGWILANKDITSYFHTESLQTFLDTIKAENSPCYYEYISDNTPVNLFFDIEIYKHSHPLFYDNHVDVVDCIRRIVSEKFAHYSPKFIVLESHTTAQLPDAEIKKSYHIIVRLFNNDTNENVYFKTVEDIKHFVNSIPEFCDYTKDSKQILDISVYRCGLFRTIHSSKSGQNRPLVVSELSDAFDNELECFVTWCPEPISSIDFVAPTVVKGSNNIPKHVVPDDLKEIKKFVKKEYGHNPGIIREISVNNDLKCITIALNEKYCEFLEREHKSNHQYIILDIVSSKQKCHDPDCKDRKHKEVKMEKYPKILLRVVKKLLHPSINGSDLTAKAQAEGKEYILENFDSKLDTIQFDEKNMIFRGNVNSTDIVKSTGTCAICNFEHQINDQGYCQRCTTCNSTFPKSGLVTIGDKYKQLKDFWVNYNQLIVNGDVITNNYYNGEFDASLEFQLDSQVFNDEVITRLVNESLDGHKISKIAELLKLTHDNFVYDNEWYKFENSIWAVDKQNIEMRKQILDLLSVYTCVKTYYSNKRSRDVSTTLIKNIKSLETKLNKPGFKDEIIKEAILYYNEPGFQGKLNCKKHLVPFTNGVYDLIKNTFRKTEKTDYVNLTMKYHYDPDVCNSDVTTFLEQVLPIQRVREYVLKKMSECLNGDIPNTNFMMFIGDSGANGKSQLLNLMKLTMGEFGEKVEVTLLTRKRNNANEANTEKIKLMNKRFAFLSEPEDGEKINIGLLKELTGSEEIVARGLYQESSTFVMETKLFLACNELPEIKGEDAALWRRIRVVDFPSKFVDNPVNSDEYQIDRSLPSRMREDLTWRQTFANILIKYYSMNIPEPPEVKMKTNEYKAENNDFENWLRDNIRQKDNEILKHKDVCELYLNKTKIHSSLSTKLKKQIEKHISDRFPTLKSEYGSVKIDGSDVVHKGWKHLVLDL